MRTSIRVLALLLAASFASGREPGAAQMRIGVLGLFHPRQITVTAPEGVALVVHAGRQRIVLESSSGVRHADFHVLGGGVMVEAGARILRGSSFAVTDREGRPADISIGVPGKLTRRYRGTLEIKEAHGILISVVSMDLETAVASVVKAESLAGTPLEALKAQAVAARSYFVAARGRHRDFDFCDTTHCQFLRDPPAPADAAAVAAFSTRNLVVAYASTPLAAMYTRSCGGRTHTPAALGLPSGLYPYYPVECKYCREHPSRWRSRVPSNEAASLRPSNEAARLAIDRRLGWSKAPSNDFTMKAEGKNILLEGTGQGHGIGLCQAGAKAPAQDRANFRQIIAHYYPNTTIVSIEE